MAELRLSSSVRFSGTWSDGDFGLQAAFGPALTLSTGTGANQANALWKTRLSINPNTSASVDLGSLAISAFSLSGSLYLASVKLLYVQNLHGTSTVLVGGADTNRWAGLSDGELAINAGAFALVGDAAGGLPVGGSSRVIVFTNTASDATTTLTANLTNGSATLAGISSTTGLVPGMIVTGTSIASGTTVASVVSATSVLLSKPVTATATASAVNFDNSPAPVDVCIAGILD